MAISVFCLFLGCLLTIAQAATRETVAPVLYALPLHITTETPVLYALSHETDATAAPEYPYDPASNQDHQQSGHEDDRADPRGDPRNADRGQARPAERFDPRYYPEQPARPVDYYRQPATQAPRTQPPRQDPRQDPRYGQPARASGSASSSGSYDSRYGQPSSSSAHSSQQAGRQDPRYDARQQQQQQQQQQQHQQQGGRGEPRYDPYAGRQDPRYDPNYRQPGAGAYDSQLYPPPLKTLVLSESSIYVFWTDPANSATSSRRQEGSAASSPPKYTVKYSKQSRGQSPGQSAEETREVTARELHLTGLEPGTDYSFSIKANRNGQETGWSAPIHNRTLEMLPQSAPSNIIVDARDRDATITLHSAPEGFKGAIHSYMFLYAPSGGNSQDRKWLEQQIPGSYAGSPATVVLRDLKPGEEYYYTVQAINSRGSGPYSEIQSFKTQAYSQSGSAGYPYGGSGYQPYPAQTRAPAEAQTPESDGYDYDRQRETTESPYARNEDNRGTPDYYGRYQTNPRQEATTPDYYGRYQTNPRQEATTPDYWAQFRTTTEDYYARQTEPRWSPYWEAATQAPQSRQSGGSAGGVPGGPEPPTDVKAERMDDPSESLVTFTPSVSSGVIGNEILYTYDQTAPDDQWQIEAFPGDESQTILSSLTLNVPVYVKIRAKNARGYGPFSEIVTLDDQGAVDAGAPGQYPGGAEDHQEQGHGDPNYPGGQAVDEHDPSYSGGQDQHSEDHNTEEEEADPAAHHTAGAHHTTG